MATLQPVTASWINGVINRYNSQLGLSLPLATTGQRITAAFFNNIISSVASACVAQGKSCALPPLVGVGQRVSLMQFPDTVTPVVAGRMSWSSGAANKWVVPAGVTSVMIDWIVGAGASGGVGCEFGFGSGSGGGGGGGFRQYYQIAVNPGDTLTISIGAGGQPAANFAENVGIDGGNGGDTRISVNGVAVAIATGGQGGKGSRNYFQGSIPAPGGIGGSFNGVVTGLSGQAGQVGTSDTASCYGGAGAPGPLQGAFGGAGGVAGGGASPTGASAGKAAIGYGSGGGGGGSSDRSGAHFWPGGPGVGGYVEIAWPANGSSGATPAANNSSYSASAVTTTTVGGGYTGGNGLNGYNSSGIKTT